MKNALRLLLLVLPCFANAQTAHPGLEYSESPDIPQSQIRNPQPTSPPYSFTSSGFSVRQVNVDANGQNILGDAANEPSIAIDPTNPLRMAAGWRQFDTIASNFRQAGTAFTLDGGLHWLYQPPIEPGIFRSDPVLETDADGNFYYNSLSSNAGNYYCHVFKSAVGTTTWGAGTYAYGGDKQWMAIDQTNGPTKGNIYAFWKQGISACAPGAFTRSLDGGLSYEPCELLLDDPTRGTLVVGNEGEVYACGGSGNGFVVAKSSNAGTSGQPVEWDFSIPVNMGGPIALYAGPNPTGMLGQAWIDVDRSGGATHGNLYLLATVTNASNDDPCDVMFSRSEDGGMTWSPALRIHDDPGNANWQWFGSLSVAPNGRIDVTWYDTREFPGEYISRLYYSHSEDGGLTWSTDEPLGDAFDPHLGFPQQTKIGDYNHQRSDNGGAHLAWAATFNGEEDIFYSYIEPDISSFAMEAFGKNGTLTGCSPNPFAEGTTLRYVLRQPARAVQLRVLDARGCLVAEQLGGMPSVGENFLEWRASGLPAGMYFCRLVADGDVLGAVRVVKVE